MKTTALVIVILAGSAIRSCTRYAMGSEPVATKTFCEKQGMAFIKPIVTINGDYRQAHCRKKIEKRTKAERIERLNALKIKHPEMGDVVDQKIKEIKK